MIGGFLYNRWKKFDISINFDLMSIILLKAFLIFPFVTSVHANADSISDTDKAAVYQIADRLSICGGNIYALSEAIKYSGKQNAAIEAEAQGNGRYMAAAWLLYSTGIMNNWQNAVKYAKNSATNEKQKLLALIEISSNPTDEFANISKTIEKCQELDKYQIELVSELRKFMYERSEQVDK